MVDYCHHPGGIFDCCKPKRNFKIKYTYALYAKKPVNEHESLFKRKKNCFNYFACNKEIKIKWNKHKANKDLTI